MLLLFTQIKFIDTSNFYPFRILGLKILSRLYLQSELRLNCPFNNISNQEYTYFIIIITYCLIKKKFNITN